MCDSGSSFGASWWTLGTFSAPVARPEPIATGSPMNFTCSDLQRVSFERRSPARDLHVSGVDRRAAGVRTGASPILTQALGAIANPAVCEDLALSRRAI